MDNQLGKALRKIRREQKLTQQELARDICAQSMLSAIENGKYMPSARLLIALCQRLGISLDQISLMANFAISSEDAFNQKLARLCNAHDYSTLQTFLLLKKTQAQIHTKAQEQAYYYYLGVAKFHVEQDLVEAERNFKMVLSFDVVTNPTTLARLALASLSLIAQKRQQHSRAAHFLAQATANLAEIPYTENLNVIFYLAGLISYQRNSWQSASAWLKRGIKFIVKHNSHYMLANCYYLLAKVAQVNDQNKQAIENKQKSNFLSELFSEQVFDQI